MMQMFPMFCSIVLLINKNQPKTKAAFSVVRVGIHGDCPWHGGAAALGLSLPHPSPWDPPQTETITRGKGVEEKTPPELRGKRSPELVPVPGVPCTAPAPGVTLSHPTGLPGHKHH